MMMSRKSLKTIGLEHGREAAGKMSLITSILLFCLALSAIVFHFNSKHEAIIEGIRPHLLQLLSVHDIPEVSRQLNGLLGENKAVAYVLKTAEGPIAQNIIYLEDHDQAPSQNYFMVWQNASLVSQKTFQIVSEVPVQQMQLTLYFTIPLYPFCILFLLCIVLYFIYRSLLDRKFTQFSSVLTAETKRIASFIENDHGAVTQGDESFDIEEVKEMHKSIFTFKEKQALLKDIEQSKVLAEHSRRIAHDVESKARTALSLANEMIDEASRIDLKKALQGILDISNTIRKENILKIENTDGPVNLEELLQYSLSAKRLEYRDRDIEISFKDDGMAHNTFVKMNKTVLDTILSNIINNSVEAMSSGQGQIDVSCLCSRDFAQIKISDTGKGIPHDVLPLIFEKNFSDSTKKSTGLGLFYAKSEIESCGGELIIASQENVGTNVLLRIPIDQNPGWHVNMMDISNVDNIVVIDDEEYLRDLWMPVFKNFAVNFVYLSGPEDFAIWYSANSECKNLFLVDQDFKHAKMTGLDLIEHHRIAHGSVLVTNNADERSLQKRCADLGAKLLPKRLISSVKITPESYLAKYRIPDDHKIIFLDDDAFLRKVWTIKGQKLNRVIQTYSCADDLYEQVREDELDKTIFFLDENLKGDEKGHFVASRLHESGAREIFCVTGDSASLIAATPSVKCILPKDFPAYLFAGNVVKADGHEDEKKSEQARNIRPTQEEIKTAGPFQISKKF